ncbi:hypothetical protein FA13DRAFT_1801550 [Coprinellus micaceus]|uniref:Uncharacterized protein n=1 Tax=Coprinellus micaceus TaxID=71717 RepID=A0A4Y7SFP6_COPMI|nr:hypothetical protein FA13DRAFT_1801550 [Coprinellus micaceus]
MGRDFFFPSTHRLEHVRSLNLAPSLRIRLPHPFLSSSPFPLRPPLPSALRALCFTPHSLRSIPPIQTSSLASNYTPSLSLISPPTSLPSTEIHPHTPQIAYADPRPLSASPDIHHSRSSPSNTADPQGSSSNSVDSDARSKNMAPSRKNGGIAFDTLPNSQLALFQG